MFHIRSSGHRKGLVIASLILIASASVWFACGSFPSPRKLALSFEPDAIVVLGGGDGARGREAHRLHLAHPKAALIVTGDGNEIFDSLVNKGVPPEGILHETKATSTWENAILTQPLLDRLHASRIVIVTDWFHVPRALAVFRKAQPDKTFLASFEPKPGNPSACEISHARRERIATLFYTLRYGINPLSGRQ